MRSSPDQRTSSSIIVFRVFGGKVFGRSMKRYGHPAPVRMSLVLMTASLTFKKKSLFLEGAYEAAGTQRSEAGIIDRAHL